MPPSFVSLHTHSEYSLLDGAARVADLVGAAAADGQPGLGLTDHGNLYGALEFHDACRGAGITPILGMEAYFAPNGVADRPQRGSGEKAYHHLSLLAVDSAGWRNLVQLSSRAFLEGYHYKPRIDIEMLAAHAEGLVVLSGCLGGTVCQHLLGGRADDATAVAEQFVEVVGRENYFVEVMRHDIVEQDAVLPGLVDLARHLGVGLVATNDCHYVHAHDATAHDALLCVQTGARLADEHRFRFENQNFYLRSAAEMRALFADLPEACDNTLLIAERADVDLGAGDAALPAFPVPDGHDPASYLRALVLAGAAERYGDPVPAEVRQRVDYELGVIGEMGFDTYFLVVWDLINHARSVGVRVGPGRGSAAGSVVAYCLGIVQVDPLAYGLLFERFLNPGRRQMPDIDMDFDTRGRDEIIRYAAERYGADHVAQIATFGRIKARAAVRDAARVLDKPYALGDRISKTLPPLIQGRDTPLGACLEVAEGHEEGHALAEEFRALYDADAEVREVVDLARGLEGLVRQDGIHAGAVVIGPAPLTDILPVQRKPAPGGDPDDAPIVTQFDMAGVERLGLLKMDVLGLRNLDVIERALALLARRGVALDIDAVPLDDPATYELLASGETVGVFQLEGAAMRRLLRRLAPSCFDDVAAVVALYRPGPMAQNWHNEYADRKNGRKPVLLDDPDLEGVLGETYGLMIYQESLMQLAQVLAGYSLADADELRKACGKKKRDLIAAHRERFVAGCVANGYAAAFAERTFDTIEPFADYAFNKSHATCYGLVSYQTAYLKAHHPAEYLAALISSVAHDMEKAQVYLAEAARLGIAVRVPDINVADVEASVDEGGRIVLGLASARNVGSGVAGTIVAARADAPFTSLADLLERVPAGALNRRTLEALVHAGALDSFGPRAGVLAALPTVADQVARRRRDAETGALSLFADAEVEPPVVVPDVEFDRHERMAAEKAALGVYVTDHPLAGREEAVRRLAEASFADLDDDDGEGVVRLIGVVTNPTTRPTKAGGLMGSFTLAGLDGFAEVTVFPKTLKGSAGLLVDGAVVSVAARRDERDGDPGDARRLVALGLQLVDLDAEPAAVARAPAPEAAGGSDLTAALDPVPVPVPVPDGEGGVGPAGGVVTITVSAGWCERPRLESLRRVLAAHSGDHLVELAVEGGRRLRLPPGFAVTPDGALPVELAGIGVLGVAVSGPSGREGAGA